MYQQLEQEWACWKITIHMIQNSIYSPCSTQTHLWAQNLKGTMITAFVHQCCIWTLNVIRGCQMKITSEPPFFPCLFSLTWLTHATTGTIITFVSVSTNITFGSVCTTTTSPPLRKTTTQPASQLCWLWLLFEVVEWRGSWGAILWGANRGGGGWGVLSLATLDEGYQVEDEPTEHNEKPRHHKGHHVVTSRVCDEPCRKNSHLY